MRESQARGLAIAGGKVRVVVEAQAARNRAREAAEDLGAQTEAEYESLIQALISPSGLESIAADARVRYVRPPLLMRPESVTGEGVAATNASAWHALGFTGAGVQVAIIDLGFAGLARSQAAGDLPDSLTTINYCASGFATDDHGTAVAEIVHEMAPGADLFLICAQTDVELGRAKDAVKHSNIRIVNYSVGVFNSSRGDGSGSAGSPDAIVNDARAAGILWVNAAGNHAELHWSGTYVDANGDGFLEFASGDASNDFVVLPGAIFCAALKWDDWPTSSEDFDLFVGLTGSNEVFLFSGNEQSGRQAPTEEGCAINPFNEPTSFFWAVGKFNARTAPRFDLFVPIGTLAIEHSVAAGSVIEPASAPSAFAVGAICWQGDQLEPYSSQGPTIDGRIKPDVAAPDSVSSGTFGPFTSCGESGFPGTSASAPHVAGAAALVKQRNRHFTAEQLQRFLESAARDLGPTGRDNAFGAGKLFLPDEGAGAGSLQFSAAAYITTEGVGSAPVTVTRTGGSSGTVTVNFATSDGTASAPSDYTPASGLLSFAPGETSKSVLVPIVDDSEVESDETVNLLLSAPTGGASLGSPISAVLTISDNDGVPTAECPGFSTSPGNVIAGTEASEGLVGTPGRDIICGFGGDDFIDGLGGDDLILGGTGNDRIFAGDGNDVVVAGPGDDKVGAGGGEDTVYGGDGIDIIYGQGGKDVLRGNAGDDLIIAGDGDDVIDAGAGNDREAGGPGNDKIYGGAGSDILYGNAGEDRLFGGTDDDRLLGGGGDDLLVGGKGEDRLYGQDDADEVNGIDGEADLLDGGTGINRCPNDPIDIEVNC